MPRKKRKQKRTRARESSDDPPAFEFGADTRVFGRDIRGTYNTLFGMGDRSTLDVEGVTHRPGGKRNAYVGEMLINPSTPPEPVPSEPPPDRRSAKRVSVFIPAELWEKAFGPTE